MADSLKMSPVRGDIYYADIEANDSRGSEQTGKRPVIILQNNSGNFHSPTTIVAIITKGNKRLDMPTHVSIRRYDILNSCSTICLEQIKTIDKCRLIRYMGSVGPELMNEIDMAVSASLGIISPNNQQNLPIDQAPKTAVTVLPDYRNKTTVFDEVLTDWLDYAKSQLLLFQNIEQHYLNLCAEVANLEDQIESILTELECTHCSASDGYRYYKKIRDVRTLLRVKLNELNQLRIMIDKLDIQSMRRNYQEIIEGMSELTVVEKSLKCQP